MSVSLEGGCLCDRVRYRVSEDPIGFYACHCSDCRRESGAAFGLTMIFRRPAFERLRGDVRAIDVRMPDGRVRQSSVCPECLVRVWTDPSRYPEIVVLNPGTLDDTNAYEPFGNMWIASACAWIEPVPGPRFERDPEDPIAMVRAWQEHRRTT